MRTAREKLKDSGLINWRGMTLDQMTDRDCEECLRYIGDVAGCYYV